MAGMRQWLGVSTLLAALVAVIAAVRAVTHVSEGDSRLRPQPRVIPSVCSCDDEMFAMDEGVARCQLASDFLIALAYFSIPLELLYFFLRSKVLPHRWVLLQFGLFIILCGLTHVAALWTYAPHSRQVAIIQTVLKVLTAAVSCATAFLLIRIIPVLLNIKVRELFLQHKAAELDREMGVIRRQEEMGRCVRMLTHEIRSSIDRHTILETTLVELANTLSLENCTVWMPNASGSHLELAHEQERRMVQVPLSVPTSDPTVQTVLATARATRIPHHSPLGEASALRSQEECSMAAVRLPLLHVYDSEGAGTGAGARAGAGAGAGAERAEQAYAVMVLVLPGDAKQTWKPQQVEMVEVVADQVAVALSHAAVVEESHRTRDQLVEQHRRLQLARIKAETAVRARNDFLAVMNHELRTPLQAVIGLASILGEQGLGAEQTPMVETILHTSSLLSTLISDVLRFSRLEVGEVKLDHAPFNLPALFQDAGKLTWPMARGKGLEFALQISDLPPRVVGDEKRLLQTLLNVVGYSVKNTSKGSVTIKVGLDTPGSARDPGRPSWEVEAGERHCVVRVEVRDTGKGLAEAEVATQFRHFGLGGMAVEPTEEGMGLGLAICQRFVELMEGHIWITSGGVGRGSVVTFVVKLQLDREVRRREDVKAVAEQYAVHLGGLRVMVVDDHRVNREVEKTVLERLGCTVTAVGSAVECLAEMQAHRDAVMPFDAVVLDVCMPQIDGFQVATSLHEMFRPEERPLIVGLTARTEEGIEEACKEAGMDAVLLKPSSLREIGNTLLDLVKARAR